MKKFFRTSIGKTFLFIGIIITVLITILGTASAAVMASEGVYTTEQKDIYWDIVEVYDEYELIHKAAENGSTRKPVVVDRSDSNIIVEVSNDNGTVLKTAGIDSVETYDGGIGEMLEKTFYVLKDGSIFRVPTENDAGQKYVLKARIRQDMTVKDSTYYTVNFIDTVYEYRYALLIIIPVVIILTVLQIVTLMSVSGRCSTDEELHPGPLHAIPADILVAGYIILGVLLLLIVESIGDDFEEIIMAIVLGVMMIVLGLGLCMSIAVRIKDHTLWSRSLLKKVWDIIKIPFSLLAETIINLPVIWKGVALFGVISLIDFYAAYNRDGIIWLIEKALLLLLVLKILLNMRQLETAGQALANGDLDQQTDESKLFGSFRRHGHNLNSIAEGMQKAVEKMTQSERTKAELITNVSHDIKTPLTSVINYASLISKEKTDNKKIREYSEVLLRQSERLKRLTDDLVEASKASAGSIEINKERCNAAVFVSQADGEYEQKLKDASLTLVTEVPDEEIFIEADPRRMWRIFDNLMNNICKYAQPETRVYLSLEAKEGKAVFSFRNTSREALNISPEELMARFVRGDSSRNTEGSGLGLSIAKSLTELQGGSLDLFIDGDLFKAVLTFPEA